MKNYILKRLLLIIVTIFGISIITFVITRLAPGDPFSKKENMLSSKSSQALTEENIRQNKKIYGFDKPVILNFRFNDKNTNMEKLIADFKKANEVRKKSIEKEIDELAAVAVPFLIKYIDNKIYSNLCIKSLEKINLDLHPTRMVRKKLINIFPFWNYLKRSKKQKIYYWKKWWKNNRKKFTRMNAEKTIKSYIKTGKNIKQVLQFGTLCTEYLINKIDNSDINIQIKATEALSIILKKSWIIKNTAKKKERVLLVYRWKSWWKYNKERFVTYPWYKDFFRIFSNTQYGMWLGKIITFDFDESYTYKRPVLELIAERLPISIQLSMFSIILTYLLSIPLGIFSATHKDKPADKITTVSLFILYSLPTFWVASMLLMFLTGGGGFPDIFPARYLHSIGAENFTFSHYVLDWLWHLVLPVFTLTYSSLAYLSRQMRVSMLDVINQDYIRTARAKGLSKKLVIYKHALKNALIPIITILAAILPVLIGGSIIIEEIFSINGMGRLAFEAILNRDYPVINAIAFFSAFLTLAGILLADILYAVVDPRIKFTGSKI